MSDFRLYAFDRLGEDLACSKVEARLDELLGLEDRQLELGASGRAGVQSQRTGM